MSCENQLSLINSAITQQLDFQKRELDLYFEAAERTIANAAQLVTIGAAEVTVKNESYQNWFSQPSSEDTTTAPSAT